MTKIKICGLLDQKTVEATCAYGADYLGFVFAESQRKIAPEEVKHITRYVPKTIKKVGVFVSPTKSELEQSTALADIDLVQIHGKVPPCFHDLPVIQAVSIHSEDAKPKRTSDFLLLDAPPQKYAGGNGEVFDWSTVDPKKLPRERLFIAGGLTASNVQSALSYFKPYAVDVSSGVETEGKKELKKIKEFIKQVKEHDNVSTTR